MLLEVFQLNILMKLLKGLVLLEDELVPEEIYHFLANKDVD